MNMRVIAILGCGGNAGINFVKCIQKYDSSIKIIGFDIDKYNLASCNSDVKIYLPFNNPEEKIRIINQAIVEYKIEFIHAQPDIEVGFLCEFADKINCKAFNHTLEEHKLFNDKLKCSKLWREGLDLAFVSHSLNSVIENRDLWRRLSLNGKVWCRAITGAGSKAALPVSNFNEAINWAKYWVDNKGLTMKDFMLSEYLPGQEYAVLTFWVNGELIQSQARERLVYFFGSVMPSGQSSTPAVARIISNSDVYHVAKKAILTIAEIPNGIYCVDLKRSVTGDIIPMEVNYGRFFTTSDFFAELGVNTPAEYLRSVQDNYIPNIQVNTINKPYLWIRGLDKSPTLTIDDNEYFNK